MSSGEHHKLGQFCGNMLTDKVRGYEHTGWLVYWLLLHYSLVSMHQAQKVWHDLKLHLYSALTLRLARAALH